MTPFKRKATAFKTAKRYKGGRKREKPVAFPIYDAAANKRKLKKPRYPKIKKKLKGITLQTALSKSALAEEQRLTAAGFKAWVIGVKYKDGTTEQIPIVARSYQGALLKAKPKMNQVASQIDEIVIIDPSIGEILHKVGYAAKRVAKAIGRGAKVAAKYAVKGATLAGAKIAKEAKQIQAQRAAAAEGRAYAHESPLTKTHYEKAAEREMELRKPGEVPEKLRLKRGTKITIEVDS